MLHDDDGEQHDDLQMDSIGGSSAMHVSFKEVLDRLLMLVALPVKQRLAGEDESFPPHLVANTCYLLATIISELAASSMGLEVGLVLFWSSAQPSVA